MNLGESSALEVIAMRAVETADGARAIWTDDERAWASRAAAEVVGAGARPEAFLARRAALVIEKLGERHPALPRVVRGLRWRPWVGGAVVVAAFVAGLLLDQVDRSQRINILAPPVLGLLLWNLAVYLVLIGGAFVRRGGDEQPGPLRRALTRVAVGLTPPRRSGALRAAIVALVDDWGRRSASLYAARATRLLHFAAAALAAGVITGLYVRGLVLEYRAGWESTFLDAPAVRAIVALAYAPGALSTGIPVPGVDALAAIRSPAGENAARWVHLMAATVAAIVILPRVVLALVAALVERHRRLGLALPLDEPYFQRLLRGFRGGAARVRVIPYSYAPSSVAMAGLEAVVARAFGGSAALALAPPVEYGADDALAGVTPTAAGTTLVALFNATATPEREVHGAFLATLARLGAGAEAVVAMVDESTWMPRWGGEPARTAARRAAWQQMASESRVPAIFVDLSAPDLAAAEQALDEALARPAR